MKMSRNHWSIRFINCSLPGMKTYDIDTRSWLILPKSLCQWFWYIMLAVGWHFVVLALFVAAVSWIGILMLRSWQMSVVLLGCVAILALGTFLYGVTKKLYSSITANSTIARYLRAVKEGVCPIIHYED